MTTKKTEGEKAVPTGISLPRDLIEEAKSHAKAKGYGGLSGLARHLLTTYLAEVAKEAEAAGQREKAKGKGKMNSGFSKVRKRR